ncbi:UNVERIFIED_ORG: hypothetical protein J2Y78_000817 [Buttiauxella agrestis ATCC 33320]
MAEYTALWWVLGLRNRICMQRGMDNSEYIVAILRELIIPETQYPPPSPLQP